MANEERKEMTVFDESKVINYLHTDKAEIGKLSFVGSYLTDLKERVESGDPYYTDELVRIDTTNLEAPFVFNTHFSFIYPCNYKSLREVQKDTQDLQKEVEELKEELKELQSRILKLEEKDRSNGSYS